MLTQIMGAYLDLEEIALVRPDRGFQDNMSLDLDAGEITRRNNPRTEIILRSGKRVALPVDMETVETVLAEAGLLLPVPAEDSPPVLNGSELSLLWDLEIEGYQWLARDRDGALYAFQERPEFDGAYWAVPEVYDPVGMRRLAGWEGSPMRARTCPDARLRKGAGNE